MLATACSARILLYSSYSEWKKVGLVVAGLEDSGIGLKVVRMNGRTLYSSFSNSKIYSERQACWIPIVLVSRNSSAGESLPIQNI